jgi:hypothetical protein
VAMKDSNEEKSATTATITSNEQSKG